MENMTVEEYKAKNKEFEIAEAKKGMIAHSVITVAVIGLLTLINLTLVPQFYWFIFPAIGMTIGLAAHYIFGYRLVDRWVERKEKRVEEWR